MKRTTDKEQAIRFRRDSSRSLATGGKRIVELNSTTKPEELDRFATTAPV
jgi:hypothetical protein